MENQDKQKIEVPRRKRDLKSLTSLLTLQGFNKINSLFEGYNGSFTFLKPCCRKVSPSTPLGEFYFTKYWKI